MTFTTWEEAAAATPTERADSDGYTTCLWHRQHEHYLAHVVPLLPRCPICGGVGDPRAPRHELCRLRFEKGRETPRLDSIHPCGCAVCRRKAEGGA